MAKIITNAADITLGGKVFYIETLNIGTDEKVLPKQFSAALDPKYFIYKSVRITEMQLDETNEDFIIFNAKKERIRLPRYNSNVHDIPEETKRYYTDEAQVREMCAQMSLDEKKRIEAVIASLNESVQFLDAAIEAGTFN